MTLVIGTDEAGYGPNLGPLVVAATAWEVASPPDAAEALLARAVAKAIAGSGAHGPLWGDSKEIYRGGSGLDALETGVMAAAAIATGALPASWPDLERLLGPLGPSDGVDESPEWKKLEASAVPFLVDRGAVEALARRLGEELSRNGVRLVGIRCRCVYPGRFNEHLDRGLNKSDILSQTTLALAARLADTADDAILIWCDRHGGRKRYAGVVTDAFSDLLQGRFVRPLEETPLRSSYGIGERGRIEFAVGGESRTPVALASMTAKYVRERAMAGFNAFWCERQQGLAPTAGYPVDAKRWRREAADALAAVGVADERLWRRA